MDSVRSVHSQLATNLTDEDVGHVLFTQAAAAGYLASPQPLPVAADRVFRDNETARKALIGQRIRANMAVTLEDFLLLEWVPRSPGLYFTERGVQSRQTADQFVERIERLGSEERYAIGAIGDEVVVYNPFGKMAMLQGGLGTIRLKPRSHGGAIYWFMCASGSGVAHEGLPVALPDDLHARFIERIAERGVARATLRGRLQFLPDELSALYADYIGVPQLYVRIEEAELADRQDVGRDREVRVSVAVSFRSAYEGHDAFYASYVFFDPSRAGSFERNVDWMEQTYVTGKYKGTIVTDFDEQTKRFAGAPFSLSKVMDRTMRSLDLFDLEEAGVSLGMLKKIEGAIVIYNRGVIEMGDKFTQNISNATVGAAVVGPGATVTGTVERRASPVNQEEHLRALTEAQRALVQDHDALDRLDARMFEALGQFLRLARDIQVEQSSLAEVQARMKATLDDVWAQQTAKGMKPQVLPQTLEIAGKIATNPVMVEVAKKLLGV